MKAWEWHIEVGISGTGQWYEWKLWSQQARLYIIPNGVYVSKGKAIAAARQVMKRLGLVERKEK